jgi:hypothetical protein
VKFYRTRWHYIPQDTTLHRPYEFSPELYFYAWDIKYRPINIILITYKRTDINDETKQCYEYLLTRVEAGSNTSTVTLRVVGGDRKGSLESETVEYGHESYGTRTRK